jgi:hypothetical protein
MKHFMFIRMSEKYRDQAPPQALMEAMGGFVGKYMKNGMVKDTAGLKPSKDGYRIRLTGGKLKVTDGPFTESKEVIGGYAIVETKTKEEAKAVAREFMELHRVHWPELECESEVRQLDEQ